MPGKNRLTIPDVVARFADYYQAPGNGAWGSLHVMLDDGNEDAANFCYEFAIEHGDHEGAALAEICMNLTATQIRKLPSKVHEYIKNKEHVHGRAQA